MLDFSSVNILVVGDIMLDKYYTGDVSRISPEAPVPVVLVDNITEHLGGACNVVNNLAYLKSNSHLIGVASNDNNGSKIKLMLEKLKISYTLSDFGYRTTAKLRVIGSRQQVVRLDFEDEIILSDKEETLLKGSISKYIESVDLVVISDYGKGVCSKEICSHIISESKKYKKIVIVDPKGSDWSKYYGATIITPNIKELGEVVNVRVKNIDEDIIKYGNVIRDRYNIEHLIVTRSDKGITLLSEKNYVKTFNAEAREIFDVSGAGDTVVSTLAVSLASSKSLEESIQLANKAAGIVVGKACTVPITIEELNSNNNIIVNNCNNNDILNNSNKIVSEQDICRIVREYQRDNKEIVFTNGCFDILHIGHIKYLSRAKLLGDKLVVGLNSDRSVKALKGNDRPINRETDRAEMLSALNFIDYIVIFDDDTPLNLLKLLQPDILVKGGDYKVEDVIGREYAARVELIDFVDGYSSTSIIDRLRS